MEAFLEILKYVLPSIVVFVTAYLILQKFMDNEYRKQMMELKKNNLNKITPLRLQAYERMVLFLERMALNNLINRLHTNNESALQFKNKLIAHINSEFDHNLTQQLYLSAKAWEMVRSAKEETIKIINIAYNQLEENATGTDLGKKAFELVIQLEKDPARIAVEFLKKDIRQLF